MYHVRLAAGDDILEISRSERIVADGVIDDEIDAAERDVDQDLSVLVGDVVRLDSEILLDLLEDEDGVGRSFVGLGRRFVPEDGFDDILDGIAVAYDGAV